MATVDIMAGNDVAPGVNAGGTLAEAIAAEFCIAKGMEGLSYTNSQFPSYQSELRRRGKPVGYYLFVWPNYNPVQCAINFVNYIKPQPGELLALDFEPATIRTRIPWEPAQWPAWIVACANQIHDMTNAWPMLYISDWHAATVFQYATAAQASAIHQLPLWKAGVNDAYLTTPDVRMIGSLHGWPVITAWQWNGSTIDKDLFFGNTDTWKALAVRATHIVPPPPPPDPKPTGPNLAIDGKLGPLTMKALQTAIHVTPDGICGPVTRKALQKHVHVTPDGIIGPITANAISVHVHDPQHTSEWTSLVGTIVYPNRTSLLTEYVQKALNKGVF